MPLRLTEEQYRDLVGESTEPTWDRAKMQEAARKGESMAGANMAGLDLAGAYLANADLERADLSHAILSRADLRGARLANANLSGVYMLDGTQLDSAKMLQTKWDGAILKGVQAMRVIAPKADFRNSTLVDCEFRKSMFQQADFQGTKLEEVTFMECDLGRVNFRGVDLRKVRFPDSYLVRAELLGATIDWQDDRILLWAIIRECLTQEEVKDLSRRACFGDGVERPGVEKPWWTWFPKEVIADMSRWRQSGDNWPLGL